MQQWLAKLTNIGVTSQLSFEDARKTKALNLLAAAGIFATFFFLVSNIIDRRYLLCTINVITMSANLGLIYSNYKRYYQQGYLIISLLLSAVFAATSLLFHNNMEFYLLLIIGVSLILMNNIKTIVVLSLLNALGFLLIYRYGGYLHLYASVTEDRKFANLIVWVILLLIFLQYFKKQSISYQKEIEDKNCELQQQQIQLLSQKQQLEESNHQLTILNKTKEKLFSIVAHDIRTPIAGLKTSLELFNQDIISKEEFMTLSTELSVQVDQLQNSLDNLLQWSHSQMKGIEVKKEKIALKPLILETLNLLQQNLSGKNIKIDLATNEAFMINADINHIKIILRNLISNAIKFSYAGSTISLSVIKENSFILFSVADAGTGMPKEKLDSLFQQNTISSQYGTSNEKGTGLGLMLCKEFIEKNGGNITVKSEPGKGSTFTVSIPTA